ncbi:MAG: sel1 repeat family protein [Candidatus Electrothrix sp. AW2]|nr:sel1 repeat family protein [Candidatus Electrothrix gigas]
MGIISFLKQYGMVKDIKNFIANLFRSPQKTASPVEHIENNETTPVEEQEQDKEKENSSLQQEAGVESAPFQKKPFTATVPEDAEQGQEWERKSEPVSKSEQESVSDYIVIPEEQEHLEDLDPLENLEPLESLKPRKTPEEQEEKKEQDHQGGQEEQHAAMEADDDLVPGGIYAVQGQEGGPYWLAKVIYTEEQIVHVICYAEYMNNLAQDILEQELTVGLKREDSSFGSPHLPIPKAHFAANTILIGQRPLTDSDFRGYRIYVDSVFDCLDEQAPDWLKKAGSYAAWRYDHQAMAALVDRYLIGVDLLRDSRKSLYWLNRLVYVNKGYVQLGESIIKEKQILTGGIYACPQEGERYRICKIVLKDKYGVQQINFPALLGQIFKELHPIQIIEQASVRRPGHPPSLSHASLEATEFLSQSPIFLGLLPITQDELHCYRAHLRKMFDGAIFRESAWDNLLRRARQGEVQAQLETAYHYLNGDLLWEVQRDIPEAIRWFTEAANQGDSVAAYNLAVIFQQGEEGIAPDPQLGFEWLTYSAQLNCGLAQMHLAGCYQRGKGCTANPALALAWYSLAIFADNDLSEENKKRAQQRKYALEDTCSKEQLIAANKYLLQLQGSDREDTLSQTQTQRDMYV